MVGFGLKLQGADEVSAGTEFHPARDDIAELVGIADHVRKEPVHGSGMARIKGETAADAVADSRHAVYLRGQRSLVDTEYLCAEACQNPCPTAGRGAEIQTQITGTGTLGEQGKGFPKFEVGPAWRINLVLVKVHDTVRKR